MSPDASFLTPLADGFWIGEWTVLPRSNELTRPGETIHVEPTPMRVLGREVATLHAGALRAGAHAFALDGHSLPAGLYLVRVESGSRSFTERVTVVR